MKCLFLTRNTGYFYLKELTVAMFKENYYTINENYSLDIIYAIS